MVLHEFSAKEASEVSAVSLASAAKTTERVGVEEFTTADDFLAHVDTPLGAHANTYDPRRWVFRGVKNAAFDLSPAALRKGAQLISFESKRWESDTPDTEWEQIRREMFTLHQFFAHADAEGIVLPEDSQALRAEFNGWLVANPQEQREALRAGRIFWPPDNLLSISGLAQHYRLPTRLLDWTYHPLVAAYFAASGAAADFYSDPKSPRLSQNLAVWALSERAITVTDLLSESRNENLDANRSRLRLVTAPTATNANLRAQHGLFILMRPECVVAEAPVTRWDLRSVVESLVAGDGPSLYQWVLPISEAPNLLRLLAHKLVSAASVYPGLWGVVRALKERGNWDPRAQH